MPHTFWPHLCRGTRRVEHIAEGEPCNWCEASQGLRCEAPEPVEPPLDTAE